MSRKKSVQESRDLVAEARGRIAEEKARAEELAAAEAVVREAELQEARDARKAQLNKLLADYNDAKAAYEKQTDVVLADLLDFVKSSRAAVDSRARANAARQGLKNLVAPQGFLGDESEAAYNVPALTFAEHLFAPGETGDANAKARVAKAGGNADIARGLLTQPGLVV
jgi:hypothetical protein